MGTRRTIWLAMAVLAGAWSQPSLGQTIEERVQVLENKIAERGEAVAEAVGLDVHALLMTDFNWDFNNPPNDTIPLSTFNYKADTFTVRDAALFIGRQREDESFGGSVVVDFGDTARAIQARWGSGTDDQGSNLCGNSLGSDCFVELREAYLTYKTPLTIPSSDAPITLKGGKFITLLGYEVIPTYTNFNPNISTSFLFGFSIPFTHTGLLAHFPILDQIALDLGVVNGWDVVDDNNSGKTLLGGLGITPADFLVMYISGTYGEENLPISAGGPGAGSKRGVISANAVFTVNDMLQFAVDGTWANDSNRLPARSGSGKRSANWYGVAGYAIVQPMEKMQIALRGEWFDDPDGTQTGATNGQTLWEVTPTFSYGLTDHITFRTEYRHDESDKRFFLTGRDALVRGQDLVFTELILAF